MGEADPSAAPAGRFAWYEAHRASPRTAFLVRTVVMVLSTGLSLLWTRWLVRAMGNELYGVFLSFLAVVQLGGLGDLGLSGAMGVRVMHYTAQGQDALCRRFLANGRGMFLILAVLFIAAGTLFSGLWPRLLHFTSVEGAGPLPILFAWGGVGVALLIVNGYFQTLNYVHGNVTWPIIPAFLCTQAASLAHWLLALRGAPLWMQYLPHLAAMAAGIVVAWGMLRLSHPWLAELWPCALDRAHLRELASTSFWVYLVTLGSLIYVTTDRLVINAFFGPEAVPAFRFNARLPELAITLLAGATFVAMPGTVRRLLSGDLEQQEAGRAGLHRVQLFQAIAGCAAAMGYLALNDTFIRLWLGPGYVVPLAWQYAFATALAVTLAGDAFTQVLGRLQGNAVRISGLTVLLTALLNLGLSILAARWGSILGILLATLVAQTLSILTMCWHACRRLGLPVLPAMLRAYAIPLLAMLLACTTRHFLPGSSPWEIATLSAIYTLLLYLLLRALGVRWDFLWQELRRLRK
jgi:O-antigen/teichoic acid export membrane protein